MRICPYHRREMSAVPSPADSNPSQSDPAQNDAAVLAPAQDVRVLLSTVTPGSSRKLAVRLVEEGLAACVNVVPGLRSVYRWKGATCDDPESLLVIKAAAHQVPALARRLRELHPYDVPEILTLAPESGSPAYLAWIAAAPGPAPE